MEGEICVAEQIDTAAERGVEVDIGDGNPVIAVKGQHGILGDKVVFLGLHEKIFVMVVHANPC